MHRNTTPRRGRLARAVALLAGCALAGSALTASPAAAVTIPVGSVQVVSVSSGFSPGPSKTVSAVCPAARPRVLGGGFTIAGTHLVVSELRPVRGTTVDSYRVTAVQDEVGTTASWQLLAYAYCASVAPGWELVSATSGTTSDPFNSVLITCPSGKSVVGSGGRMNGGAGQVHLNTQGIGAVGPNKVAASGLEDRTGFAGTWSVTGYAVCVTDANPLDIRIIPAQTGGTDPVKTATATCPTGFRLTGSAAYSDLPGNLISLRPNNSTPNSVAAVSRDDSGAPGTDSWTLQVSAFCAL